MFERRFVRCQPIVLPLAIIVSAFCFPPTSWADDPRRPPAIEAENVPPVPDSLTEQLRQYQSIRSAAFRGWAPSGRGMLIQTRFGQTAQLHRVDSPGGRREQLTFFDEPVDGRFVPGSDDGDLLITMSRGGDENDQIYLLDGSTRALTRLTDGKSRNLLGPVSKDGSRAVIASNQRNGRDTDLYVVPLNPPGEMRLVLQTDGEYWIPEDLSPDGRRLLMKRYVSINESYPALLDLESGEKTDVPIPGGGPSAYGEMKFSADGRSAYLSTDAAGEFRELAQVDLESFEYDWLTRGTPHDVESIAINPNSPAEVAGAFTFNRHGYSGLGVILDGEENEVKLFDELPGDPWEPRRQHGELYSRLEFSPDGRYLGLTVESSTMPGDAYSWFIAHENPRQIAVRPWTFSETGGLDPEAFVAPELIKFETFDGRKVPTFYYRAAPDREPAPVVIDIHGGPESQSRPDFDALHQILVNRLGIAVLVPNVRGSAGYGKSYLRLDNAERREDSVRDIGALLDWIAERPELDADRVAVVGGSYGGYMVLGSLTNFPERIKAGIDIVGIASFTTFLQNTSPYRQDLRRAEYGDERDPAMQAVFERINPTANADKIRSALLVAHGRNDPRVPFSEAEQIVEKVRANGGKVWTVYAGNEGHGFRKKDNRDYLTAVMVMFLDEKLGTNAR